MFEENGKAREHNERDMDDFFENAAVGLHWLDPDGIILRANRADLELLGYTRSEYVGHNIAEFHVSQETIQHMLRRLSERETVRDYEAQLRCKDDSIKHVLIDSNVLWEGDRFIHSRCVIRDITAQKRAQEALRASETRFRQLSEELEQRVRERTEELTKSIQALNLEVEERQQAERASHVQLDMLIHTTEQLTRDRPLDEFPGLVLASIVDQLDAYGGSLWVYDEIAEVAEMVLYYEDGQIILRETTEHLPMPHQVDHSSLPVWEEMKGRLLRDACFLLNAADKEMFLDPDTRSYHEARDLQTLLVVPLLLHGRLMGYCRLGSKRQEEYGARDLELAQALAHQAMLAIQWTRLAEQAREAAVLHEREAAAAKRVAELDRANQALVHTLDALADAPELTPFLETVIAAITEQLGAVSSILVLYDWAEGTLRLELLYQEGRIVSAAEAGYPKTTAGIREGMDHPDWKSVNQEGQAIVHDVETSTLIPPEIRSHLTTQGVKQLVMVPLALGGEVIGVFSARLTDTEPIPPEKLALAHALAHQATLAIQLSHLAKQAQQTAVLEERNRMAREIHDTLAQAFTGILMQLGAAERLLADDPVRGMAHFQSIRDLARQGLAEARRSVQALRPQALEQGDLADALARMVEQFNPDRMPWLQFLLSGTQRELPPDVAGHLLRIGQEALTNALRHASASMISIQLRFEEAEVRLSVQDNGVGFNVRSQESKEGFGLTGIRERASLIGAEVTLTSWPNQGTHVDVLWRGGDEAIR